MSKKFLICILGPAIVIFMTTGSIFAAITGSPHDFKNASWNPSGQICFVCHTPHFAGDNAIAPLWHHKTTTATYTLYSSPTLSATVGQPTGSSKACLSCHDGTVALDANGLTTISNFFDLGTDLSKSHPISFTYDSALATTKRGALFDPTTQTVAALGGQTIDEGMLINHKLECNSCHDVHKDKGDSPNSGFLLLVTNSGSALCLTCHNK